MIINKDFTTAQAFTLAVAKHQENKLEEAQIVYNKILEVNPDNLKVLNNLGLIFQNKQNYKKAISYYERAIEINSNYADAHNNLGNTHTTLGENQKAKNCYEKAIKIDPNYAIAHNNLGLVCKRLGYIEKSRVYCKKAIEISPNFLEAHSNLGTIYQELGEYQKAKACYEKAIQINPNVAQIHNNLGVIFFYSLKEYQKAKDCYKKAIEIDPSCNDALNNLGVLFKTIGEYQNAKKCYETSIKINPSVVETRNNLGVIYKELGENQKAKDCFKKAIEISPNNIDALNNLGAIFNDLGAYQYAKDCLEKAIKIDPNFENAYVNITQSYIAEFDSNKAISSSYVAKKILHNKYRFTDHSVPLFKLKHDVQQARYLNSKDYKVNGISKFKEVGGEILKRAENEKNHDKNILLMPSEINALLPFYKADIVYQPKKISGSCINPDKNWQDVEDQYFNSKKQIIYIDDFLSEEALRELREFCLVSKVWNQMYKNKYLGAFSDQGFISPIHLQISIDLQKKLPKLFGVHDLSQFWGFKYDSTLGKGINIHADFAIHNLNFWITPDEYNNNKNSGGLKVYDVPPPEDWIFKDYNSNNEKKKIYDFLENNNANCINVPYKFNRAVLFNSAYFHETDEIDFKDEYEGRRINNTYLYGNRTNKFN